MADSWYILFVRGGREWQVVDDIHNSLLRKGMEDHVTEIKTLQKAGKDGSAKNLLPGYLFVNCEMNSDVLRAFYAVPKVVSFLNHVRSELSLLPNQLSELEVNNLFLLEKKTDDQQKKNKAEQFSTNDKGSNLLTKSSLKIGDLILIKDGFFKDHRGSVTKLDSRKGQVTLNVDFLGRLTPVSIAFSDCEKL